MRCLFACHLSCLYICFICSSSLFGRIPCLVRVLNKVNIVLGARCGASTHIYSAPQIVLCAAHFFAARFATTGLLSATFVQCAWYSLRVSTFFGHRSFAVEHLILKIWLVSIPPCPRRSRNLFEIAAAYTRSSGEIWYMQKFMMSMDREKGPHVRIRKTW